ncbi:MAG: hypothetical protein RLZZ214_1873 [Verrucomicrobiota bacterium]|jgi:tetratricopeptide (TPR) repeat protein
MNSRGSLLSISWTACAVSLGLAVCAVSQNEELAGLVDGARAAMKERDWQQALDLHTQAANRFGQQDPLRRFGAQFGAVYYQKGVCEMKLKRWDEAMRSFEICYRDFPNGGASPDSENPFQIMALCKWGEAAMGAEQWELAAGLFAKFIGERDKTRDRFPKGSFYVNSAVCQYKLGRIAEGNENLEIAIRNKENFPTPESGIIAGFQALAGAAIARGDEQALLDFIDKNRGALVMDSAENRRYSGVFLKLAGDASAAGMPRAALAVYQLVPNSEEDATGADSPAAIRLAAVALIHEKAGNLRGAFAAYELLESDHPRATNREGNLYQLIRTASLIGESDSARRHARMLYQEFPKSPHLVELRAMGFDVTDGPAAAAPTKPSSTPAKALPKSRGFAAALDLYQGRRYEEAKSAFREIQARHQAATPPDAEISTLAAFYESECLRKLGDLDGLAKALQEFVKNPALDGNKLRQIEIDGLWDAVRTSDWNRVDQLAGVLNHQRLPGDQRSQTAYCRGLALEHLGHPTAALMAYHTAITADAGASEEIARQAALNVMRLHRADAEVQAAIAAWGAPGDQRDHPGYSRLREAASVAALFELSLGAGTPLPVDFKELLKYGGKH